VTEDGRRVFEFLRNRGRDGLRYAPRIWEAGGTIGRGHAVDLIFCKKWHVAKRLARKIEEVTDRQVLDFVFDEIDAKLPDLGGIERAIYKRNRHRRAFMKMVLQRTGERRLTLLLDPARSDILADLKADKVAVRTLEIEVDLPDDYLTGHAERIGLLAKGASPETVARMLPALRNDIGNEIDHIRDDGEPAYFKLSEFQDRKQNGRAVAEFLQITPDDGAKIVELDHLFSD
jgi:hypothetical protein